MLPCSSDATLFLRAWFNALCLSQCSVLISMPCACFNVQCLFQCSMLVSMSCACFNVLCLFQCSVLVSMLCACFNALCLFQCSVLVSLLGESMTCALSPPSRVPTRRVPPHPPKPPKTLVKSQQPQKNGKHARAVTRTTPEIGQAPVPSHPGTKYPVRGNPSLQSIFPHKSDFLFLFNIFGPQAGGNGAGRCLKGFLVSAAPS